MFLPPTCRRMPSLHRRGGTSPRSPRSLHRAWKLYAQGSAALDRLSRCRRGRLHLQKNRDGEGAAGWRRRLRDGSRDFAAHLRTLRRISILRDRSTGYATDLETSRRISGFRDKQGDIATDPGISRQMAMFCDEPENIATNPEATRRISGHRDKSRYFTAHLRTMRQMSRLCDGSGDIATCLESTQRIWELCDGSAGFALDGGFRGGACSFVTEGIVQAGVNAVPPGTTVSSPGFQSRVGEYGSSYIAPDG